MSTAIALCPSDMLRDSEQAFGFDVVYHGQACRAFAVRYQGRVYAYLNRCSHVPMEMDYQPDRFFDSTGHWLICATHGALYHPATGRCSGGPCRGGLVAITLQEEAGTVHWHTAPHLQPPEF